MMAKSRFLRDWLGGLLTLCILGAWILGAGSVLPVGGAHAWAEPTVAVSTSVLLPSKLSVQHTDLSITLQPKPGGSTTTQTHFMPVILRNYTPPLSVFGVQMWPIADEGGLQQALAAGVHWVRNGVFYWDQIEPVRTNPPTYHWEVVDETGLINAARNRMVLISMIRSTPEWAQKIPGYTCGPVREDKLDEFAQFLQALVSRYSRAPYHVRFWELWNEPDVDPDDPPLDPRSPYGCWGDSSDPGFGGGYYAEMLKAASPAIKAADPNAHVLLGGLLLDCDPHNPPPGKDCHSSSFLDGILANGGGPHFDVVSFHAYTYYLELGSMVNPNWPGSDTAVPMKTAFLRSILDEYGLAHKPLINTEAALLCSEPSSDCRETQAMYMPRAYAEAMALGLTGQLYYRMINESWKYTGLLWRDEFGGLHPKPAYHAYATAAAFLADLLYESPVQGYPTGIEGYTFADRNLSSRTDVVWSADGSAVEVTLPPGSSAYDRYGDLIASSGTISVDHSPVYVIEL